MPRCHRNDGNALPSLDCRGEIGERVMRLRHGCHENETDTHFTEKPLHIGADCVRTDQKRQAKDIPCVDPDKGASFRGRRAKPLVALGRVVGVGLVTLQRSEFSVGEFDLY